VPEVEVLEGALRQILTFWNPADLEVSFDDDARDVALSKLDRQGDPDRATADDDYLVRLGHACLLGEG
jgi:hypothetical protein